MAAAAKGKVQEILAIFEVQKRDGTYKYTDREVREFLPLLVLTLGGATKGPLPKNLQVLMDGAAATMGISPDATPDQIETAVHLHYRHHPPNRELKAAFLLFVRRELGNDLADKADLAASRAEGFKKFQDSGLGAPVRRAQVKEPTAARGKPLKESTSARAKPLKESTSARAKPLKESTSARAKPLKESTSARGRPLADPKKKR